MGPLEEKFNSFQRAVLAFLLALYHAERYNYFIAYCWPGKA
jgi:hypothetical protein